VALLACLEAVLVSELLAVLWMVQLVALLM